MMMRTSTGTATNMPKIIQHVQDFRVIPVEECKEISESCELTGHMPALTGQEGSVPTNEQYHMFRDFIVHEDKLVDHRVNESTG